jgi:dCTP deaminase
MILNDTQITQLCVPPKFMVKRYVPHRPDYNATNVLSVFIVPSLVEFPSYQTEAEIQEEIKNSNPSSYQGTVSYRILTEAEYLNFNPMIKHFVERQIREHEEHLLSFTNRATNMLDALPEDHLDKGRNPLEICLDGDTIGGQLIQLEKKKVLSYGVSSMGYDVRLDEDFKIFSNVNSLEVDPKNFDENCLIDGKLNTTEDGSKYVVIPPNSYLLGRTTEEFDIPRNMMVIALGKSTYARAGAIVNVTPIEPGFKGTVVIEISNSTPLPLRVYANEGIAQFIFLEGQNCAVSYGDRDGKYQNQFGLVLPKV